MRVSPSERPPVPSHLGRVIEQNEPKAASSSPLAGRRILIVQDVHLNPEAQKNNANLFSGWFSESRLSAVATEGAFQKLDFDVLRSHPDTDATRIVADAFLDENRINGLAHAAVTATNAVVHGVDDESLYDQNLAAYHASRDSKQEAARRLADEARALAEQKQRTFHGELVKVDATVQDYRSGKLALGDFLLSLSVGHDDPLIARFLEAVRLERDLNLAVAEKQRVALLERLLPRLSTAESSELFNLSSASGASGETAAHFTSAFVRLLNQRGVSIKEATEFRRYLRYRELADSLPALDLVRAVEKEIADAYGTAVHTRDERLLVDASEFLHLKRRLVEFELTPEEWTRYQSIRPEMDPFWKPFEDFYRLADERSRRMVAGLERLARSTQGDARWMGLLIGGFHSPYMTQLLAERGAGYAVVAPQLTRLDTRGGSHYLSIFDRENAPLERLFEGERLFMLPKSGHLGAGANVSFRVGQAGVSAAHQGRTGLQRVLINRQVKRFVVGGRIPWGYVTAGPAQHYAGDVVVQPVVSWGQALRALIPASPVARIIFVAGLVVVGAMALMLLPDQGAELQDGLQVASMGLFGTITSIEEENEPESDEGNGHAWWGDPAKTHIAVTLPIFALRREDNDPGIGKFSDLPHYYRNVLRPAGVRVMACLPFFTVSDESPYSPVSLFAVNKLYIDWAETPEAKAHPDFLLSLVAHANERAEVNYVSVRERERRSSEIIFRYFDQKEVRSRSSRARAFQRFQDEQAAWLPAYIEDATLRELITKPVLDWTLEDIADAKRHPSYAFRERYHCFTQWVGYQQLEQALAEVHAAGGRALFDIPFYRAKASIDVRFNRPWFQDPKTTSAGIINGNTRQIWGDLVPWNWPVVEEQEFEPLLAPYRHWLKFGFDGARVDALHFAYPIGQLGSGNEPGERYVSRLVDMFREFNAFGLAEAFEGKADEVQNLGLTAVDRNWKRMSTHDDAERKYSDNPIAFMKQVNAMMGEGIHPHSSRFIGFTLGDLDGTTHTIKRMNGHLSQWRYRQPVSSSLFNLGWFMRLRTWLFPKLRSKGKSVWESPWELRHTFAAALTTFVRERNDRLEIWAASQDWFLEQWGRDTFIAFTGIFLSTGRLSDAKRMIREFAAYEKNGLIPNRIRDPSHPESTEYNTSDASMWFIQAIERIRDYDPQQGEEFAWEMLPVMKQIMDSYQNGTGYDRDKRISDNPHDNIHRIWMDREDGLIITPSQSTWMDADPHGQGAVTPRWGKAVEINALYYSNLRFIQELEESKLGRTRQWREYKQRADRLRDSFNLKFWNDSPKNDGTGARENALFDVVDGDPHKAAIRPNMIFAVSHGKDLLSVERRAQVFESVHANLFTPYGLRTLDSRDSNYRPHYNTWDQPYPHEHDFWPRHKDYAYHQGTAWPWLLGGYIDAMVRVRKDAGVPFSDIQNEIRTALGPIVEAFVVQGSLHEVYDGSQRDNGWQWAGGNPSQAWSVAEVFRVLHEHGVLPDVASSLSGPKTNEDGTADVPGALGLWKGRVGSLWQAGAWEGMGIAAGAVMVAAATVTGIVFTGSTLDAQSITWMAGILSLIEIPLLVLVLFGLHKKYGVLLSAHEDPVFTPSVVNTATMIASISLLSLPFLNVGMGLLFLGSVEAGLAFLAAGVTVAIVPHAILNDRAEKNIAARLGRTLKWANSLEAEDEQHDELLAQIPRLELVGISVYSPEGVRALSFLDQEPAFRLTPAIVRVHFKNPAALAQRVFVRRAIRKEQMGIRATRLDAEINPGDHVVLVYSGGDLRQQIRETKNLANENNQISVVATVAVENFDIEQYAAEGIRIYPESELTSAAAIEQALVDPAVQRGGQVKLLVRQEGDLPAAFIQALLQATRRRPGLVRLVLFAALLRGAPVVSMDAKTAAELLTFRRAAVSA